MAVCASGQNHSLFLDPLGNVWGCGGNQHGQLGLGHNVPTFQKINNLPPIISIAAGDSFSLFIDDNGSVWSCGRNDDGELGLGTGRFEMFQNKSQTFQKSFQQLHLEEHQYFLIVKDQFGPVDIISVVNWDWDTQKTETKQKRFEDSPKLNLTQQDGVIYCFLIVKDQFGPVGTIHKEIWDWATQDTDTTLKRLKDFLKSNQWQEEEIGQYLWTNKAMFGFVEPIKKENWGWATKDKSTHHRKTTIFLELLLLLEDTTIIQCFWTKKGIFTLAEKI